MPLSDAILNEALNAPRGTLPEVAARHGVNHNTLRREVGAARRGWQEAYANPMPDWARNNTPLLDSIFRPSAPENGVQRATGAYAALPDIPQLIERPPLQFDGDTFLYTADWHAPLYSKQQAIRVALVADTERIDTLVIGGDIMDFQSASSHPKTELQASLNETITAAGKILDFFLDYFDRIYVLPGNHDVRLAKKLDSPLSFEMLIRAGVQRGKVSSDVESTAPIITTDNTYLYIGETETGWVAGHPDRYTRTPVNLTKAAQRERRHVLGAHTHLQSLEWSDCGKFFCIYPGHCTEPRMTPYVMRSKGLSTYAESKAGFVLVRNNMPLLLGDGLTNWSKYGTN